MGIYASKKYEAGSGVPEDGSNRNEQTLVRSLFCVVLSHYIFSARGGWHQLEETVNFLLLSSKQVCHVYFFFLTFYN